MVIIIVSLRKINKMLFALSFFMALIYTIIIIKYLPPRFYISFSHYVQMLLVYNILVFMQIFAYNKSQWKKLK